MNRREFARLLAIGGAVPFVTPKLAWARPTRSAADARVAGRKILDCACAISSSCRRI